MSIQGLGYLGIGTDRLDDWTDFAANWLGMQAVDRGAGVRAFRMDDRKQRLVVDRALPEGQRYFGWEVRDAAALDALAGRVGGAGGGGCGGDGRAGGAGGSEVRERTDLVRRSVGQSAGGIPRAAGCRRG